MAALWSFLESEMVEGYLDGCKDERDALPENTNRSRAYVHGWLNGRDDRLRKPRDSAANQLLQIGQQERALPVSNLANIAGLLTPIAQLGGNTTAHGQTEASQTMSPAQQAWGWMNAFSNLNKSWGSQ